MSGDGMSDGTDLTFSHHPDAATRLAAVAGLGRHAGPDDVARLVELLDDDDAYVIEASAHQLIMLGPAGLDLLLWAWLETPDEIKGEWMRGAMTDLAVAGYDINQMLLHRERGAAQVDVRASAYEWRQAYGFADRCQPWVDGQSR